MKHLKITSLLLSVVMCVTMAFPTICVMADEAAEPSETQTEAIEKKPETKAPEKKQEPKETEKKEEPKETAKQEPKDTEKKEEPKETVKQEPAVTETQEPTETEKQETKETEKKEEPTETEKPTPEGTETKESKETESQAPAETEKKQEPAETETTAPSETETQAPEETESEKEPEATEDTDESVTKTPKNTQNTDALLNVKFANGIMSWNSVSDAYRYILYISGSYVCVRVTSYNINEKIDYLIKYGVINKSSSYQIDFYVEDSNYDTIAQWSGKYSYNSAATRIPVGSISNVKINNGVMTWNAYNDFPEGKLAIYYVFADDYGIGYKIDGITSFDLNENIDGHIKYGHIENHATYKIRIELRANGFDEEEAIVAQWNGNYSYNSPVKYGKIPNVIISNGILTWGAYNGTDSYRLWINNYECGYFGNSKYARSIDLNEMINHLLGYGVIDKSNPYIIKIIALDTDEYCVAQWNGTYKYKERNTLSVSGKTAKVKNVRKKKKTLKVGKVIKFNNRGQGKITYSKASGSKKISINGSNGKVTVKKKTKKGTYKVSVWVKAAGDANHFTAKKKVTFKIKVK